MHQDVERLAARDRHFRLGDRRGADVTGRIGGRLATAVDRLELLVGIVREDEVVMDQLLVPLVEAEVEHHARTRGLVLAAAEKLSLRLAVEELAMGADAVGVAHDDGGRDRLAGGCLHTADLAVLDDDPPDRGVGADIDAEIHREACQRPWDRARAAPRIPDAVVRLHVGDAAEHGR